MGNYDYSTVQFREPESVVSAYQQRGIPKFAIRNKGQFLHAYKGEDM
jgi:hypothetical protein